MTTKLPLLLLTWLISMPAFGEGDVVFQGNRAVIPIVWRWSDDSHRSSSIKGHCVVGNELSPCHRVEVQLTDPQGRILSRTYTASDGSFSFPVKKETRYRLRVASDRYEFATQDRAELQKGDQATLVLMPRRGPASLAKIRF